MPPLIVVLKVIVLGIVEGITEFLPISSTGHLIIVGKFLKFEGSFAVLFDIVIQLGAILAIIYLYHQRILESLYKLKPGQPGFALWSKIIIAFVPSAVLGFLFKDAIEQYLFFPATVSFALIIGAIIILLVEKYRKYGSKTIELLDYKMAFLIGLAQCFALFPGMSRSASTIIGGMLVGLSLIEATVFSFFLAIPTMLAATIYSLLKDMARISYVEWSLIGVGFVVSFITALIVVRSFVAFLTKHSLKPFAYYRLIVGALMLGLIFIGVL